MYAALTIAFLFSGEFPGLLLGDKGYPCEPYLLTPFPEPHTPEERNYNYAHARTRVRIEMAFGILKARFSCLNHLRVTPDRACDIIVACSVLHNIAGIRNERAPQWWRNERAPQWWRNERGPSVVDYRKRQENRKKAWHSWH